MILYNLDRLQFTQLARVKIEVERFQCERYEHKWVLRGNNEEPAVCLKCKGHYQDKPRIRKIKKK